MNEYSGEVDLNFKINKTKTSLGEKGKRKRLCKQYLGKNKCLKTIKKLEQN